MLWDQYLVPKSCFSLLKSLEILEKEKWRLAVPAMKKLTCTDTVSKNIIDINTDHKP